jgi:hypothetical protein
LCIGSNFVTVTFLLPKGPLAGMIFKSIPDLAPSFARFAVGLKRRVEGAG